MDTRHGIVSSHWFCILATCGLGCTTLERKQTVDTESTAPMQGTTDTASDNDAVDLVLFDQWGILDSDQDPFPDHRMAHHNCDPSGVLPEDNVLEINTNDCDYAVVGQPLRAPIQSGDMVELLMYHSALSAIDEPAEAHFSVMIGDQTFWDITIDIPWQSEVYLVPIEIDFDGEAGTMVRVHLHNHGGNSWRVAYLKQIP